MKSHLDTGCPCYCPYCDITADREVIGNEHKEKCHKFLLTSSNNIGVDNVPCELDRTNNINELQDEVFKVFNSSGNFTELQNKIYLIREEAARSLQIAKECFDKIDKQNDTTMLNQLYNIGSYGLVIAVLIIAILIALQVQSHYSISDLEKQITLLQERTTHLQQRFAQLQEQFQEQNIQFLKQNIQLQNQTIQLQEQFQEQNTQLQEQSNQLQEQSNQLQEQFQEQFTQLQEQFQEQFTQLQERFQEQKIQIQDQTTQLQEQFQEKNTQHQKQFTQLQEQNTQLQEQNIQLQIQITQIQEQFQEQNTQLQEQFQKQNTQLQEQFQEQNAQTQQVQKYYFQLSNSVWTIKVRWLLSKFSGQVAPVIVNMPNFTKKLKDKEVWYSSPFFAFNEGYQMRLKVYPAGVGKGEGTHISVFLYLMKGPYDDTLKRLGHWPLRGTFIIELLNLLNNHDHHMLQFHHRHCINCTKQVLHGKANNGWGYPQFISHDTLLHPSNHYIYLKSDLLFMISYEDMEVPYRIAPITVKVTNFSYWLESGEDWHSSSFFAFNGGYQMCLRVYPAGFGKGKGTHVSVDLYLMKGPHDNKLDRSGHWPLIGTFTIKLLNQLNANDHHKYMVDYDVSHCSVYEVKTDKSFMLDATPQFISHDTLLQRNAYLKNDMLKFRISYSEKSDGRKWNW